MRDRRKTEKVTEEAKEESQGAGPCGRVPMVTVAGIPVSTVPVVSVVPAVTAGNTTVALPMSVVAIWFVADG